MYTQSWHSLKPRKRDALLQRIADNLEARKLPTLDDAVTFEEGVMSYLAVGQTKTFGFRNRIPNEKSSKSPKSYSPSELRKRAEALVNSLACYRELPKRQDCREMAQRLRAYVAREIPVSLLLGERERNSRSESSVQIRETANHWIEYALKNLSRQSRESMSRNTHNLIGREGNLYSILSDITSESNTIEDLIKKHVLCNDHGTKKHLKIMRDELLADIKAGACFKDLSPWSWQLIHNPPKPKRKAKPKKPE